jgi:hypothetical protein
MSQLIHSDNSVRVHKYLPTVNDVHIDTVLTDLSVAYVMNPMYANSAFPIIPVNHQTDKYYVWPKADWFRDEARKRAPGTPVARGGKRLSNDSYFAEIYEWGDKIPREVLGNADNQLSLDLAATQYVMQILNIRRERDFAAKYLTTGIWGTDITGVASNPSAGQVLQWNAALSTPIDDVVAGIRTILLNTGRRPNTLILGFDVWAKLKTNAQILARVVNGQTSGQAAQITTTDLARLFEVERVIIAEAVYNTAKEGQAASMSFIAGKVALLAYVDPNPSQNTLTAGATFVWNGMANGSSMGTLIERWWNQDVRSFMIDGFANWDMKVVAADAGYFFTAIVA